MAKLPRECPSVWLVPVMVMLTAPAAGDTKDITRLNIGTPVTQAYIAVRDTDVMPDGTGLPDGRGTAEQGEAVYADACADCHGPDGRRGRDRLSGPADTAKKTIGNFWPYATTLFDYIQRAMPPDRPGSLSTGEVYALTAHLLTLNGLIEAGAEMNPQTLPRVQMPARDRFVPDDRRGGPEVR